MKSVWKLLSNADPNPCVTPDPQFGALDIILRGYLLKAIYIGQPPSFWESYPTESQQRECLRQISVSAGDLLRALGGRDQSANIANFAAWDILDRGLRQAEQPPTMGSKGDATPSQTRAHALRAILVELQSLTRNRYWYGPDSITPEVLGSQALFGPVPKMLYALAELSDIAANGASIKAPKKSKTMYRNECARALSTYVKAMFAQPFHQVVATTVNVALDLKDKAQIHESLVRYLTSKK